MERERRREGDWIEKNPYIKASRCLSDAKAKQSVTKPLKQQKKGRKRAQLAAQAHLSCFIRALSSP